MSVQKAISIIYRLLESGERKRDGAVDRIVSSIWFDCKKIQKKVVAELNPVGVQTLVCPSI